MIDLPISLDHSAEKLIMCKELKIPDFSGDFHTDVPMSGYTTWHVGGPAEYLVEPKSIDDISAVFNFASTKGLPITIIGYGSNILVSDTGIPGITVCMKRYFRKAEIDLESGLITAEAGCSLPALSHLAELNGISGFEFLVGIPGTVGGGMVMNAGMGGPDGSSIRDILVRATLLDCITGDVCIRSRSELDMRYRHTNISSGKLWALKGEFKSEKHDPPERIRNRHKEIIAGRKAKQPDGTWNAGSVFRRPEGEYGAGWYIERAGLKGFCIGGAVVSRKHANWIINEGTATADDIIRLIEHVSETVYSRFGVTLDREVHIIPEIPCNV